jgi:hypothetical protein
MRLGFDIASGSKFPKLVVAMAEVISARGYDPGTADYRRRANIRQASTGYGGADHGTVHGSWFMVHGSWFTVHGSRSNIP